LSQPLQSYKQQWPLKNGQITYNRLVYEGMNTQHYHHAQEMLSIHIGLRGSYFLKSKQLVQNTILAGVHNNLIYAPELDLTITNTSNCIETLGVQFEINAFLEFAEEQESPFQTFTTQVIKQTPALLSSHWYYIHNNSAPTTSIKSIADKQRLFAAREILIERFQHPPTIKELAKLILVNEYKLKKGFKELFGYTILGFIHTQRMQFAKQLLLDTNKPIKEISYEVGYGNPAYFSRVFKKEFGLPPNKTRNTPIFATGKKETYRN